MVQTLDGLFRMSQMKNGPGGMAIDNINGMVPWALRANDGHGYGHEYRWPSHVGMQQIPLGSMECTW